MRWMQRLLWAVGALLVLWGVAFFAVPPLVKWQAEEKLTALLGRQVTIGDVAFHPWSLQLTVSDLAIAAAPGSAASAPQFQVARVAIDADARSLLRLAPVVESLQIDAPKLRLARTAEGRYDIDDILQRLAPKPDAGPRGEPPRGAIYNVELTGGDLVFDDGPVHRQHHLSGLTLALPFLSNLPSQVEVEVQPRLAFTLDGASFDSGAQAVPFARSRRGTLALRVGALDLEKYAAYVPESLPVRLQHGRVGADLALDFAAPEEGGATVSLRGTVGASELALTEAGGAPLLALSNLSLALSDVQPLARKVALGALQIDGLALHVARDSHGALSLQRLAPTPAAAPAPAPAAAPEPGAAWRIGLASLAVANSKVLWDDAAVKPASSWVLADLTLSAQQVALPSTAPMPFSLKTTLRLQGDTSATLAVLALEGQATTAAATAKVDLSALSLAAMAPYVNASSHVLVTGTGAASGKVEWAAATPSQAQRIAASFDQITLDAVTADDPSVGKHRGETLALQRLLLAGVTVDLTAQAIAVASAKLQRPQVHAERSADGTINLMRLAGATPLAESERVLVRNAAQATWQFRLDDFALDDGSVRWIDAAPGPSRGGASAEKVQIQIDKLRLGIKGLQVRGPQLVGKPEITLSARIADAGEASAGLKPGLIEWRGQVGMQPLLASGKARIEHFPVQAVQAYLPHDLGVRLRRADAGFRGDVALQQVTAAGLSAQVSGDVLLGDLRLDARSSAAGEADSDRELLSWQAFALNGVKASLTPGAAPKVAIHDATLSDFYARLVLTEQGRLNLSDVAPRRPADAASAVVAGAFAPASAPADSAASAPAAAPAKLPLELSIGGLRLAGGRVDYSDRFVKPNYSAALTDLKGEVGAFRYGVAEPAALRLSGRVAGTGLLEISGKINPNAAPRELDVTAKATDIELAPLSPYSVKYAGYAIERGKLSVEVHYKIDPDGKLEASHQVILNQLTFGEHVDSPSATKLPVRLAIALLKDKDGVIDINLPVTGTLADPQFSVGPIIWKVIINLLTKAITAPFSLLSGGGGPDLSSVPFQAGTSLPTDAGNAAIAKVAKALEDRPALKMTVVGEADPSGEFEALQRATVEQRLLQEQRREELRASGAASAPKASPALTEAERARLVKAVYRQTAIAGKPRNMIGMQSDISTAEMEELLRKNVSIGPEAMRELALQRGLAVRDALIAKGLASERLFLGDPKLRVAGPDDGPWTPQVKLTLDTK